MCVFLHPEKALIKNEYFPYSSFYCNQNLSLYNVNNVVEVILLSIGKLPATNLTKHSPRAEKFTS